MLITPPLRDTLQLYDLALGPEALGLGHTNAMGGSDPVERSSEEAEEQEVVKEMSQEQVLKAVAISY
uniref:Uncharacterized protein n=1 Tax=Amphimedon queenslandica TaxID=400682 RepID=A0A1X7VSS9_AMPQE